MQLQIMKAGSPSSLLLDLWSSGIWFWETVENIELSLYLRENQHCKEAPDWKFMVSRCFTCVSSCVEWRSCLAIETLQYSAKVRTTQNLKVSVYLPSLVESTAIFFFFISGYTQHHWCIRSDVLYWPVATANSDVKCPEVHLYTGRPNLT